MGTPPIDIVRAILAGWAEGEMWAGGEHYARDVLFTHPWPEGSYSCRGVEELTRFMVDFLGQWDRWRVEGRSFTEVVPGTVLVEGHDHAVGSESGIEVENPWFGVFVFRGDEIAALHVHHLRREALAAAGFTEAAADTG